ncbi:hypothetical protein BJF85_00820 [Saccharomonospora sp. CUA-673]|uniref:ABC transporter ATP-binding protein n=1 Tax=Saccharomonospora sp. CUA-673 TaxID=1904969 RepID=UPI00095FAFA4|nr:ABC transporter ATP-binding protein [Saccharomonospora sp. CUA-673]OLT47101.1 hypothetical protein BJF85_00820 [Saccharomonospora sp. CUA-673]
MSGVDDPHESLRSSPSKSIVDVDRVGIGYRQNGRHVPAVGEATFRTRRGERTVLLGPSGSGKSTLLKAVAGFLTPDSGSIVVDGRVNPGPGPDRAVVFQEFDQLLPWRTVLGNVTYPLRVTGTPKNRADTVAREFLQMTGLQDAVDKFPHQLSGGMKQRVAIARALAIEPLLLLMDEPFGALDAQTRGRLQRELVDIVVRTRATLLFVTHSIDEAVLLGDEVVVLGGTPSTIVGRVDTAGLADPDDPEFVTARKTLRGLLTDTSEDLTHATFE